MSKGRKVPDVERTATMLDLVRQSYYGANGGAPAYVVIEEVAPSTGFGQRWADVLALSCWRSNGLTLDGYEIKASKADLKRELDDLSKHQAVARYCDTWTLVVWDESLLMPEIPEDWGITLTVDAGCGTRDLRTHRKPQKRTPEPWPRDFVCSLVRNAFQQSAGAAYVARAVVAAQQQERVQSDRRLRGEHATLAQPLVAALWPKASYYNRPAEANDPKTVIELAAQRLMQGELKATP